MPTPQKPEPRQEREVPREVRHFTNGFVLRKLTWRERLMVLLGYNLAMEVHIATEHRPGRTEPLVKVTMTPYDNREQAAHALKQQIIAEQDKRDVAMKNELAKRKAFTPPPLVPPAPTEKP